MLHTAISYIFLGFCMLCNSALLAQEGWSLIYNQRNFEAKQVPSTLSEKQTSLAIRPSVQVGALGLAPDGGWVLTYRSNGANQFSWNGAPRDLMTKLEALKAMGANIQQIIFSPLSWSGKSSWLVVSDDKEVDWQNVPPTLIEQILAVHQRQEPIRSIALAINGGWVLVTAKQVYHSLIPSSMATQLKRLQQEGADIHYVAFNVDNGWIVLHDRYKGIWERIPNSLVVELERLGAQQSYIRSVHFYTVRGRL